MPPGRAGTPCCGVLSRPDSGDYRGSLRPCITTPIAPRRRATFHQTLLALHRLLRPSTGLAAIVAGSAALLAVGTFRVKEWVVMTDELLYAKLAGHIADTGSPLPVLHGEHVGFLGVVYPILLAPFYGTLDPVAAFEAAHILNAVLFASAAIPVYLLVRRLPLPAACALVVALLIVAIPWAVDAAFVMSEAAAYPVFVWAILACHAAITEPSPRRDALVIGALALAFFTRPQFLFLAAVLPLAILVADGPRRSFARHRPLAAVYAVAILAVVPLAALGQAHRLLGDYGVTATQGSLLPAAAWKSAAIHLDVLAVGLGVLPFLLGAGWIFSSLRSSSPGLRAFAALAALSLPLLALEAGSYDVRFGGVDVIRDRYVFYLAPLLLIAVAACLQEQRLPLPGIAATTVFLAATAALADFRPVAGLLVDSPEAVLNGVIHDESAGLPAGVFVAVCGVLLGVICLALAWLPRPLTMLGVTVAVFAFCGSTAGYAFERLLTSRTAGSVPVTGQPRVRDWVDRAAAGSVGLLAYPISRIWGQSAITWWDAEFWNHSVTRAFVDPEGTFTYTPFPSTTLRLDAERGRFEGTEDAPPYLLTAPSESRFGLAGSQAAANGLVLLAAERPYRALWATDGLDADGWTRPSHAATIRVYAQPGQATQLVRVTVALDAPPEAQAAASYRLGNATGSVAPGQRAVAEARACVPRGGHADLALAAPRSATIAGPPLGPETVTLREVGLALSSVQLTPTGQDC
jgi:hypothetical protein